jgi:hypothetical protein
MYIYFGVMAVLYFLFVFITSNGYREPKSVVNDANLFFGMLPVIAGGFFFSAIYNDDLNSKNLIAIVGFGINKTKIVIAKLILMTLAGIVICGVTPLFHYVVYIINGCAAKTSSIPTLYIIMLKYFLLILAYASIAGIAVYGTQRKTFSMVLYILLATGIIGGLIELILFFIFKEKSSDYTVHLIGNITNRILLGIDGKDKLIMPIIEYIAYIIIAAGTSIAALHRKEMEF